jgi:hypothetical protein
MIFGVDGLSNKPSAMGGADVKNYLKYNLLFYYLLIKEKLTIHTTLYKPMSHRSNNI